jgi:predicted nucleic acid-binding protein
MILYFDTSALVALFIHEDIARHARRARSRADRIVASVLAYPETLAAFSRRHREGDLTAREYSTVTNAFRAEWSTWIRIPLDRRLLPETSRLLKYHPVTGSDAVHLASALLTDRRLAHEDDAMVFACNDARLRSAAVAEGLAPAW